MPMEEFVWISSETSEFSPLFVLESGLELYLLFTPLFFKMEPYLRCVSHSNVHPKLAKWSQSELTSKFNGSPTFQGKSARIWKTRQSLCWTKLVWWLIFSVKVRRVKNIFNQKNYDIKNPLWSYITYASVLLRNSNQQQSINTTSRLILKLKYKIFKHCELLMGIPF